MWQILSSKYLQLKTNKAKSKNIYIQTRKCFTLQLNKQHIPKPHHTTSNQRHLKIFFLATYHVEVQSVDADAGVVLDAQIDVLLDTEAKVSGIWKVVLSQLVLTDLEAGAEQWNHFLATQQ